VTANAPVIDLFGCSRPPAIAGSIAAVVVDAIKAAVGGSFSHIGEKIFKSVPSFADPNSSPSVVFVAFGRSVVAAREHPIPRCEGRRAFPSACMFVFDVITFVEQASARFCGAILEIAAASNPFVSAGTDAVPRIDAPLISVSNSYDGQATKLLTGDVGDFGHGFLQLPFDSSTRFKQFKQMNTPPPRPGI